MLRNIEPALENVFLKKKKRVPLDRLINLPFAKGIFPDLLKLASVIPVFKKGNSLEYNNYRPISLTSNISKVMEKPIYQRLYMIVETNEILYKNQLGFRNKHSTNHALIDITEKWEMPWTRNCLLVHRPSKSI